MKKSIIKKISLIILLNAIAFCTFSQTTIDSSKVDLADTTKTQEMYQLVDGTWITKKQLDSIFQIAWDNSFGKMTEEENELLFGGTTVTVETQPVKKEDEN
jgi:hypothetical protein